jgi:hypothetical protein
MAWFRSWDVPEDFWILQWRTRWERKLIMRIDGEPARKGDRGKREAVKFQRQVLDEMERYGRYPFAGPVALDLHFRAVRRNPPAIYHVAKNVLDLLGPALPGITRPRRHSVLYRDDRQIKLLYVDHDQRWDPARGEDGAGKDGSTYILARRARDAVADLCTAHRLSSDFADDLDDEDEDSSPFFVPDLPDDLDLGWLPHRGTIPAALTQTQAYLADVTRFWHVMEMQKAILARTDALLLGALCIYLGGLGGPGAPETLAEILRDNHAASRDLLLSNPFTLPLPGLPQHSGEPFTQAVRDRLQDFRVRLPLFRSLLVPVTLTFLVVPPQQGKDLDNIALTVLPIAHKILRPHIEPYHFAPTHPDEPVDPRKDEALHRLRSLNANSVTAYQVVELPRSPDDPPEGVLQLALGPDSHGSWWERAASYLEQAIDQADRQLSPFEVDPWRGLLIGW